MRIAGYEMGKLLGEGRFGEVRLVTHIESGEQLACKIAVEDTHRRLLRREAEMQRWLTIGCRERWSNAAPLFPTFRELIERENKTLLVMEYVRGVPLSRRIGAGQPNGTSGQSAGAALNVAGMMSQAVERNRNGMLQETEMLSIAIQLAEGLKTLHEGLEAILYRDLKPEHVMLCGEMHDVRQVRLLDLGCACKLSEAWKSKAGSRGYAAPEQLDEGIYGQGVYSDIYSFGKILQAMNACGSVNGDWKRLITWCTAKDPRNRIPCMRLVLQELHRMQQGKTEMQSNHQKMEQGKKKYPVNIKGQPMWMRFQVEKCICE